MVMIKKFPDEIHFSKYGYARLRLIFTRLHLAIPQPNREPLPGWGRLGKALDYGMHLAGREPPPDFLAIPQIYTSLPDFG